MIRAATDADVGALRALRHAWTEEDRGGPVDDPSFDDTFAAWWDGERGHRRFWIAEVDGDVVGMASVVVMSRMPRPGVPTRAWGYVHNMFVAPAHRDGGIGAALLGAVIEACRADGFEHLTLHPRDRAVAFYERLGFRAVDDLLRRPL